MHHITCIRWQIGKTLSVVFIGLCLIAIVLSVVLPAGSHAWAVEVALKPEADTFVKSSDPDRNFGSAGRIGVDAKPQFRSFLRFGVSGVGQNSVARARLRLFVVDASPLAGLKVFRTDAAWDELAVTWHTQPGIGTQVAELAPTAMNLGTWVEIDLGQAISGDGTYSFALTTGATDLAAFAARTKDEAPQLVLTLNTTTSPTPTATSTPVSTAVPANPIPNDSVQAFPGAEGFGASTPGGRSGRIIYVTSLADSGPGSLRAALEASGPRIVLFKVAGTITLQNDISISQPYATVAGQTAPGEGVQIKGGMIKIRTHDVVIRYLKIRAGDELNSSVITDRDALSLSGGRGEVYNVVIDHCSLVWGPDIGGLAILANAHDITVQNSIMGEGLYLSNHLEATVDQSGHSLGVNVTQLTTSAWPRRITLHHNLLTTSDKRMPQIMGAESVDVVNNVIYNWGASPAHGNPRSLNLIKNMFIKGPMTQALLAWEPRTNPENPTLRPGSIFEQGNVTEGFATVRGGPQTIYSTSKFAPYSIRMEHSPQDAYNLIISDVGANRPVRDSVDQRIITNLVQRTGKFLNASDLGWPNLASGPVPADSDSDGMPDSWEQAQFGTTSRGSASESHGDFDGDGYTDVEEYLNGTDPKVAGR